MIRLTVLTAAAACTAVAAFAATGVLTSSEPEAIEIPVAPEKLAECRQTLREVGGMPAVTDAGTPILFDDTEDLPGVVCVAAI